MLIASLIVMILCLTFEGLIIVFSGFPFPGLPIDLYAEGIVWLGTCVSAFFYPKRPLFALILGWIMLILTSVSMRNDPGVSHSASGYLYSHSLELIFIVASHLGYFTVLRRQSLSRR